MKLATTTMPERKNPGEKVGWALHAAAYGA